MILVELGWKTNTQGLYLLPPDISNPVTKPHVSCGCDIAAHTYTWSFEPNPTWSSMYAGSDEIWQYFQNFTQKYGLEKYCKFNHQVSRAAWNAKTGKWDVEVTNLADGTTILDSCDILINAGGFLNSWRWPDIPGLKDFKGVLLHTARWDPSVDLSGKHVGLIGNGYGLPSIHHF